MRAQSDAVRACASSESMTMTNVLLPVLQWRFWRVSPNGDTVCFC